MNGIIRPEYLKSGDKIGLAAPGSRFNGNISRVVEIFESWGLVPVVGRNALNRYFDYAGSDDERAEDLQNFVDDPEIKAIICLRGGYGCMRLSELVDFATMTKAPKWLVGFSDITVFHSVLNCRLGVESIHAEMPLNFPSSGENESTISLKQALFGKFDKIFVQSRDLNILNIPGKASGRLIGGNLSVLQSIAGTSFDVVSEGCVLFLEDVCEAPYRIDRMMLNLKYSGKLSQLSAVIAGSFTDCESEKFGKSVNEIIVEHVCDLNIPVLLDFPAGHSQPNTAMYFGRETKLDLDRNQCTLSF